MDKASLRRYFESVFFSAVAFACGGRVETDREAVGAGGALGTTVTIAQDSGLAVADAGLPDSGGVEDAGAGLGNPACHEASVTLGMVYCDDGWSHRASIQSAPSVLPRPGQTCDGFSVTGYGCTADTDCSTGLYGIAPSLGFCAYFAVGGCGCGTGCLSDADCASNEICAFGIIVAPSPIGQCVTSFCRGDADCPNGYCASGLMIWVDVSNGVRHCQMGYACTSTEDECFNECLSGLCVLADDGHRHCLITGCIG